MEQQENIVSSKRKLMASFEQLLQKYYIQSGQFEDKQKTLQQEEEKKILEAVTTYTVESIVKGLADVQLDFRDTTQNLSDKIITEVKKLSAENKELKDCLELALRLIKLDENMVKQNLKA